MRILLLLLLFSSGVAAQSDMYLLYIMRDGEVPAQRLRLGDEIAILETEAHDWYKGSIVAISDKIIQVGKRSFALEQVEGIRTYNNLGWIGGQALWKGGLLFAGIAVFNGIINNDSPIVYPVFLYWTGGLAITGGIIQWFSRNTYRVENNWYYKIVDYKFEE